MRPEDEKSVAIERAASLVYDRIEPTGAAAGGDEATEADTVASFVRRSY